MVYSFSARVEEAEGLKTLGNSSHPTVPVYTEVYLPYICHKSFFSVPKLDLVW